MNLFKKTLLFFSLLLLQPAWATEDVSPGNDQSNFIIELNNKHIEKCQSQLFVKASTDKYPVILLYADDDDKSALFMPTYKAVAKSLPQRQFFRYNLRTADPKITNECLGLSSGYFLYPTVMVSQKSIDGEILSNPLRAGGGIKLDKQGHPVSISNQELIQIITFPVGETTYTIQHP